MPFVPGSGRYLQDTVNMAAATYDINSNVDDITTIRSLDVTLPKENASGPHCSRGIPGVVSYDTIQGLSSFNSSYGGIHGYVAVAVCLFGVLSNSAIIIVLTRKNMVSSTNTILMWLAVSDLLTMLSYLPFAIHFYIMEPQNPQRPPFSSPEFPWICFLLFHASFSIVCHSIAIWLTIALAIFRYIYICMPTKGAFYCSQQRARLVIIVITFLTMLICIPNAFVNTYQTIYENRTVVLTRSPSGFHRVVADASTISTAITSISNKPDITVSDLNTTYTVFKQVPYFHPSLRQSTPIESTAIQVNNWLQAILIKLVPCGMLTTLTLLLIHAMHKAYRKRLKLKSQGKKAESDKHGEHNRTTGMLLMVVVLFTLTELPQGILTLMNIFIDCFYHVVYYKLGDLLDIVALINNSVNFVLYCTMSTQFRNTFSSIFCPKGSSRPRWLNMRIVSSGRSNATTAIEAKQKNQGNNRKSPKIPKTTESYEIDKTANNHNHKNVEDRCGLHQKEAALHGGNCNLIANELQEVTPYSDNSNTNSKESDCEQLLLICSQHQGPEMAVSGVGNDVSHTHGFTSDHTHV